MWKRLHPIFKLKTVTFQRGVEPDDSTVYRSSYLLWYFYGTTCIIDYRWFDRLLEEMSFWKWVYICPCVTCIAQHAAAACVSIQFSYDSNRYFRAWISYDWPRWELHPKFEYKFMDSDCREPTISILGYLRTSTICQTLIFHWNDTILNLGDCSTSAVAWSDDSYI